MHTKMNTHPLRGMLKYTCIVLSVVLLSACVIKTPDVNEPSLPTPVEENATTASTDENTAEIVIGNGNAQEKELEDTVADISSEVTLAILEDWTWTREGSLTRVEGQVENTGDKAIGFFRIKAEYVDSTGQVLDVETTVSGEPIQAGAQKAFKILKAYDQTFKSVRIWIDEVKPLNEPVVSLDTQKELAIQEGWVWEKDGAYTYIKGSVKNNGEEPIYYYRINAEYKDEAGQVLDTDFTNSGTRLDPGSEAKFEIMHPHDNAYAEVIIYISKIR